MSGNQKKLTFEYKISDNYAVYSIDGGHGGVTPKGDIIMNLFSERGPIPRKETFQINEKGGLESPPIEIDCNDSIIRNVMFGISLKPSDAESIAGWLLSKAKLAREQKKTESAIEDKLDG